MDLEASEASESECDESDDDSISEGLDDYDDNMSEYSNYSTTNKNERLLRREKREKAKKSRDALWRRFGLTVAEETDKAQDDIHEEERSRAKRQKRNHNALQGPPIDQLTAHNHPSALKQSTLNFNKVTKNRRLFSRKELKDQGMLENHEEEDDDGAEKEAEIASPGSLHGSSKRHSRVPPGYKYQKPKGISAVGRRLRRRTERW